MRQNSTETFSERAAVTADDRLASRAGDKRKLRFDLSEIDVRWDADLGTLWSFMAPSERACFTTRMLKDLSTWQDAVAEGFGAEPSELKFLVLGSYCPGVFSLGGDLEAVLALISQRDLNGLVEYGKSCTRVLHRNYNALGMNIVTIGLLQGDAVGGGVETALSFDVLIAERQVSFSFPENAFGLFPGVGAHSILTRRIGASAAERMILAGRSFSADELHRNGLVHVVAEPGEGEAAAAAYIKSNLKRQRGQVGIYHAARSINPISLEELDNIARIWAETAVDMSEQNMLVMRRLSALQARRSQSSTTKRVSEPVAPG